MTVRSTERESSREEGRIGHFQTHSSSQASLPHITSSNKLISWLILPWESRPTIRSPSEVPHMNTWSFGGHLDINHYNIYQKELFLDSSTSPFSHFLGHFALLLYGHCRFTWPRSTLKNFQKTEKMSFLPFDIFFFFYLFPKPRRRSLTVSLAMHSFLQKGQQDSSLLIHKFSKIYDCKTYLHLKDSCNSPDWYSEIKMN